METLTIKFNDIDNMPFLIELLSKFTFVEEIETSYQLINLQAIQNKSTIRKAEGKPSIDDFAGIWQNNPKTLEQIREKAWKRTL